MSANLQTGRSRVCKVDIVSSPPLSLTVNNKSTSVLLDTGAESSMILLSECKRLGIKVLPTSQRAFQADGLTPLDIVGEVRFYATRRCEASDVTHKFDFNGLYGQN